MAMSAKISIPMSFLLVTGLPDRLREIYQTNVVTTSSNPVAIHRCSTVSGLINLPASKTIICIASTSTYKKCTEAIFLVRERTSLDLYGL